MIEIDKIKKVVLGEASSQEKEEVDIWIGNSSERANFVENVRTFYTNPEMPEETFARLINRIWRTMPPARRRKKFIRRWATVAACAALIAGFVATIRYLGKEEEKQLIMAQAPSHAVQLILSDGSRHEIRPMQTDPEQIPGFKVDSGGIVSQQACTQTGSKEIAQEEYAEILVSRGGEYILMLADGTKVWLNAETRLRFPNHFDRKERKVYLEGEAYFEVTQVADCPFLVAFQEGMVRVTGTEFNVKAYAGQQPLTTLVQGRVEVTTATDSVILRPGEQCEIGKGSPTLVVREANLMVTLAWKNKEFIFKDTSLAVVLEELARWYDVSIEYDPEAFRDVHVHIYMDRLQTLQEVLDTLSKAWDIIYERKDGKIIIKRR